MSEMPKRLKKTSLSEGEGVTEVTNVSVTDLLFQSRRTGGRVGGGGEEEVEHRRSARLWQPPTHLRESQPREEIQEGFF